MVQLYIAASACMLPLVIIHALPTDEKENTAGCGLVLEILSVGTCYRCVVAFLSHLVLTHTCIVTGTDTQGIPWQQHEISS